jgi:pantoate--beta-alanine ligase
MELVSTREALRECLADWRAAGEHIALVSTSGNLHDGHESLVEIAREHAERVVVSIFANPATDDASGQADTVSRSMERDQRRLRRAGVDLVFVPDVDTMFPFGVENSTTVSVPVLTEDPGEAFGPGDFGAMTSVVSRLFSLVQPDVAVFGQKDYRQQLVIRRMTEDLGLPVRIVSAPICREDDGLAMSSDNQALSEQERAGAPRLYATLSKTAEALSSGRRDYAALETDALQSLEESGFTPEYVSIRRAENLDSPDRDCDELVVLAAARLGQVRLSDNVIVHV